LRKRRKDYSGAAEDWESVIALDPKNAYYFARAAEAYGKVGKLSIAKDYYHKAMDLDPKNKNYRKRYDALQKSLALGD